MNHEKSIGILDEKQFVSNSVLDDSFFKKFKPKFDLELNMQQLRGSAA